LPKIKKAAVAARRLLRALAPLRRSIEIEVRRKRVQSEPPINQLVAVVQFARANAAIDVDGVDAVRHEELLLQLCTLTHEIALRKRGVVEFSEKVVDGGHRGFRVRRVYRQLIYDLSRGNYPNGSHMYSVHHEGHLMPR
jgi:hypothetical protein